MDTKKRHYNHMIEEKSLQIINSILPKEWVIRKYNPDYGIDLSIELFEKANSKVYNTLGEFIYVQVKGTENLKVAKTYIYSEDKSEKIEIELVKFQLETSELSTVERLGAAMPVLLFIVDVIKEEIYFLCLNDYIEKVLIKKDLYYYKKGSKIIDIPKENIIRSKDDIFPLLWYSKRIKCYSLFSKINTQKNNLKYMHGDTIYDTYTQYTNELLRLDIWNRREVWFNLVNLYNELEFFKTNGNTKFGMQILKQDLQDGINIKEEIWEISGLTGLYSLEFSNIIMNLTVIWNQLTSLCDTFEIDCREWWLPTYYNWIISQ